MIIKIKNLRAETILGIHEWEKKAPREIIINAAITLKDEAPCITDKIEDTLDYDTLSKRIVNYVTSTTTELIEKLAYEVLTIIMDDPRISEATIEIDKPGAIAAADSVSVTLTKRSKN